MQDHSNPVPWDSWLRARAEDVRRPEKVIARVGASWFCQLCGRSFVGDCDDHHREHMVDLDAWFDDHQQSSGPKPDSIRRSFDRKYRKAVQLEVAEAIGEDPYRVAVVGRDSGGHWVRRRRVRHPRHETEARIADLHAIGRLRRVIAEELGISQDYVRRVLRRLDENGDAGDSDG